MPCAHPKSKPGPGLHHFQWMQASASCSGSDRQSVTALSHMFLSWAGLQVIVITGDNKLTAEAICRKVGVFAVDEDLAGKSITGVEFMKLPLDKRRLVLAGNGGACFSRAEPKHKQVLLPPPLPPPPIRARIIKACHSRIAHCIMSGHVSLHLTHWYKLSEVAARCPERTSHQLARIDTGCVLQLPVRAVNVKKVQEETSSRHLLLHSHSEQSRGMMACTP